MRKFLAQITSLFSHLNSYIKLQLYLHGFLVIFLAAWEIISLISVVPFLSILTSPNTFLSNPRFYKLVELLSLENPRQALFSCTIIFAITVVITNLLRIFVFWLEPQIANSVGHEASKVAFRVILRQPYSFYAKHNSSKTLISIIQDITIVVQQIILPIFSLISSSVIVVAITLALIIIDAQSTLIAGTLIGIVYCLISKKTKLQLKRNSHVVAEEQRHALQILQEALGGIRDILIDGTQQVFEKRFYQSDNSFRKALASNTFIQILPRPLIEMIAMLVIAGLALSLTSSNDAERTLPVLGSLALGANRLLPALSKCFGSVASIRGFQASLDRVLEILSYPVSPLYLSSCQEKMPLTQSIRLKDVWFRYSDQSEWTLKGINLEIKANTVVAFVGTTGSGKSTLTDIIMGLLQPVKGALIVDKSVIDDSNLRSWQSKISHVPQSIYLCDGTIAENIAFGIPSEEIDIIKVKKAAELSQISEFVESKELGYYTQVGERGVRLSGGQRQRIGIARALYRNASVIIFDEATSALDSETEKRVMSAVEGLSQNMTVILIAHRLSTIKNCQQVIEIENGHVVALGSFIELQTKSPSFKKLVSSSTFDVSE